MRNGKRLVAFGILIGILLVIGIINSQNLIAGCAGDCMTCHPKLKDDKNHQSLKTCIQCHDPSKPSLTTLFNHDEGCGGNCFDCHDKWPQDSHHFDLFGCKNCHK